MIAPRLAGLDLGVPDPERTARFLADVLGFEVSGSGGSFAVTAEGEYGSAPPARILTLRPAGALELQALVFESADDAALSAVEGRLRTSGIPARRTAAALELSDASGISVRCGTPVARLERALPPSPIRPRRLGHVNLKVPDAPKAATFYQDALGLRLSEQIGDLFFFLRATSEHHNLGFRGGAAIATVHHVGFEIVGWESFRVICDHIASHGHVVEYGPGRHGPGHNLFVYVVEPSSGLRFELFSDMAHVAEESGYRPPRWESLDRVRTVNRWGPQPPQSFLE